MKVKVTGQAKTLFTTLSCLGHLGNLILLIQTERSLWQGDWASLVNPLFHLEALGLLIRNPMFWLFLGVAIAGHYTVNQIKREYRHQQLQTTTQKPETNAPIDAEAQATPQAQINTQVKLQTSKEPQPRKDLRTQEKQNKKSELSQPTPPKEAAENKKTKAIDKIDPAVQKALQWAIESSQKVRFSYRESHNITNHYIVTLIQFKTIGGKLYIEAKYAFKKPERSFEVARIDQVEILSAQYPNHQNRFGGSTVEKPVAEQPIVEQPAEQAPIQPNRVAIAQPQQTQEPYRPNPKRLYIQKSSNELRRIIEIEWDNPDKLSEIEHELSFRSRKAALELREQINARLSTFQNSPLTWSTATRPSSRPLGRNRFKHKRGLLRECGYKVGEMGLSVQERRAILDRIFLMPLQAEGQTPDWDDYLAEWGKPRTEKRLKKLAACLAAFSRNAKRRDPEGMAQAIRDWEDDLNYLKRKYAVG